MSARRKGFDAFGHKRLYHSTAFPASKKHYIRLRFNHILRLDSVDPETQFFQQGVHGGAAVSLQHDFLTVK